MAVITGTPWDLALDQSAYRAPMTEPVGPEPVRLEPIGPEPVGPDSTGPKPAGTVPTAAPADSAAASSRSAEPSAEAASPAGPLSARAAFQQGLYQRARIVDIRTTEERDHSGHLHGVPDVVEIDVAELIVWLVQHDSGVPVILLSQDGAQATAISSTLAAVDLADVAHIHGGFLAWKQSGLPVGGPGLPVGGPGLPVGGPGLPVGR